MCYELHYKTQMKSAIEMENIYYGFYVQFSCNVCVFAVNSY